MKRNETINTSIIESYWKAFTITVLTIILLMFGILSCFTSYLATKHFTTIHDDNSHSQLTLLISSYIRNIPKHKALTWQFLKSLSWLSRRYKGSPFIAAVWRCMCTVMSDVWNNNLRKYYMPCTAISIWNATWHNENIQLNWITYSSIHNTCIKTTILTKWQRQILEMALKS